MFYQNQNVIAELRVSRYSEHHVWFEGCEWPHEIKCYGHQQFYKSVDDAKTLLSSYKGVVQVQAHYTPPYIPYSIQNVSTDPNRVTITLAESN